jgi:acyl-CoA synthetase (AMP-forming)/AMP-acid ligase II/acyl carrier protein
MNDPPIPIESIGHLLHWQNTNAPNAAAILAPGRTTLSYRGLCGQIDRTAEALAERGIGCSDRVAVIVPDGPEMALAFLTLSACAAFAPLNPAYTAAEFEFYLSDVRAKALVLPEGIESPARAVARSRGLPVLELISRPEAEAGVFELKGTDPVRVGTPRGRSLAQPEDVALALHTSGTTSRPKLVALTHRNLCSSARHIADTLALTPMDRCLSIVPLFHIHGLIGVVLSSIAAGASVACPSGFNAAHFPEWLEVLRPTWYSAVPTMHQAILARVVDHTEIIRRSPLRFIRSSSSALPPRVMRDLEAVFKAPVIESYGMTEASHQITSNPLPPGVRKPGSAGRAAGPEVAIMDARGQVKSVGASGEIVVRGPSVTRGYENNPEANRAAFAEGWFRTGDQGYLDAQGYLFIDGRLREIINRGGEKMTPREIEDALLEHTGVREAVAFAIPHPTLGEDVAAAVVPKDGQLLKEVELREAASQRLPWFKVPSRIVFLKEIPTGPTGKVQRFGLADRLARELVMAYEPPDEGLETLVAAAFQQVLQPPIGRHDNFFALGGDSILAIQVIAALAHCLGCDIPPVTLFHYPTVVLLAAELARLQEEKIGSLAAKLAKLPSETAAGLLREADEDGV